MKLPQGQRFSARLLIAVVLPFWACQGPSPKNIVPTFAVQEQTVPVGSPLEVTYRFDVPQKFQALDSDYQVSVKYTDTRGEVLFTDDHEPSPPTSTWTAGQTILYSRTVFIPAHTGVGIATVHMGLEDPDTGQRLELTGADEGDRAYRVGQIAIDYPHNRVALSYQDGWHEPESSPDDPDGRWRRTKGSAVCAFMNPKTDSVLYLEADSDIPQEVRISVGPARLEVARFRIGERDLERIYIPATMLGGRDRVELFIDLDGTPAAPADANGGARGLRVHNLHMVPQPYYGAYELEPINIIPRVKPDKPLSKEYTFTRDWFDSNIPVWEEHLAPFKGQPINYLEIGVFEGRSVVWMLEKILTHPSSRMTAIELFGDWEGASGDAMKQIFLNNIKRTGAADKVTLIQGYSQIELRELPLDAFDVIYIDGSHEADDVLEDIILCWRLLKEGGVMIFDDYEWPRHPGVKFSVNVFLQLYGKHFDLLHHDYQVFLRKRPTS